MNRMSIINNIIQWESINDNMVENLYLYSEKSLRSVIIMSIFISFVLSHAAVGSIMYLWGVAMILFSLLRLSHAYSFKKDPRKYSLRKWYNIFVIDAIALVFLTNTVAIFILPQVEQGYQLFIMVMFLGMSGGAIHSLSPDYKLSFVYQVLLLIPVTVMLVLQGYELNYYVATIVLVYFMTQINIIKQEHKQSRDLLKKEQEIEKVQELLEEKKKRLEYFFDEHPLGVVSYNTDLVITDSNAEAEKLFKNKNLIGLGMNDLRDKRPLESIERSLTHGAQVYKGPYRTLSGIDLWIEMKCLPVIDSQDRVCGGIAIFENKTKEHEAYEELKYQAYHDTLTSLTNRRGFLKFIESMIQKDEHKEDYSFLLYIDLNRFKHINDSLGHAVGDQLLIEVSKRFKENINNNASLSRLGGDEFIIVVPFVSRSAAIAKREANNFALMIQEHIRKVFIIDNMHLYIKASIGIVCIEPGIDDIEEIIHQADISMYEAKEHKQNEYISFYNTELDIERKSVFTLQQDLVTALKNDQFELHFQPIATIKENTIYAAESLIRWHHPTKGLISPFDFIPLAIESGVIMDIDWWVIDSVCKQIGEWKKENKWNLQYISFNLNAQELLREDFVHNFLEKLGTYGVEKNDIRIEITETNLIDNFEDSQDVISILHQYGVQCAVDDFGTGYSSLSYLKRLSFNTLKIDKAFINDIENKNDDILFLSNIISIGKQFGYNIVLEGVENEEQRDAIISIDDDLLYQGYLFSLPLNAKEFEDRFLTH